MGKTKDLIPAGRRFNGTLYRLGLATPYKTEANNYAKNWKRVTKGGLARVVRGGKNYEGRTFYYVYVR